MRLRALLYAVAAAPCIAVASAGVDETSKSRCAEESTCLLGTAVAIKPVEQEVLALIGREHAPAFSEQRIFDDLSCLDYGAGGLVIKGRERRGWDWGLAKCQGRFVMLLRQQLRGGKNVDDHRWRIVDAHLLPEVVGMEFDPSKSEGPYLYTPDECSLDGKWDSRFHAVVRLSDRKRMDWRTGVLGAWGYDMNKKRIVPLDTKRVVCHKPEPE